MKCGRKGGREERGLRNGRLEGRDGGMGREKNKSLLFCRIVRELLKIPTYSIYPFNPAIQCLHIDLGKKGNKYVYKRILENVHRSTETQTSTAVV